TLLNRLNHRLDKGIVFIAADSRFTPSHIDRVIQQLLIIGTDIKSNRQDIGWADPATCSVECKFSNGNPHTTNALISKTQNALTICDHNDFHVLLVDIVNNLVDLITVRIGNKNPTMTAIDIRKALTCLTHSPRINNRHHLAEVIFNQMVK